MYLNNRIVTVLENRENREVREIEIGHGIEKN